jgi:hypothetical protein
MSKKPENPSAFPEIGTEKEYHNDQAWSNTYSYGGMSLRDYFAAKAMEAYLNSALKSPQIWNHDAAAIFAYKIADEMIKARDKNE